MDTTEHDKIIQEAYAKFMLYPGTCHDQHGRMHEMDIGKRYELRCAWTDAIKAKEDAVKEYKATHKSPRKEILAQIAALVASLADSD